MVVMQEPDLPVHTVPIPRDNGATLTPTAEQLTEAITGAIADAPQLTDDARWIWAEAYWPPGKNPDRPTRVPMRKPEAGDPDHVPGPQLALGVGNDQARAAYTRAAVLVVEANRLAGRALAPFTGRKVSDGYRRPARGDELPITADSAVRRLRQLLDLVAPKDPEAPRLEGETARDAHAAAVALVAAHAALKVVLRDDGGTDALPGDRRCDDCGKACEDQKRRKCWQCVQRRARGKKPVRRWAEAHAAKGRRVERGEDHAENPAPSGDYVDGVWTPAKPFPKPTPRQEAS